MDSRAKELIGEGEGLFSQRVSLLSLWQEMSENFYPERADFTVTRWLGQEFAANLVTSYPLLVRRELHGQISGMLRPNDKEWAEVTTRREDRLDKRAREWLQMSQGVLKRAMYDPDANFVRAAKETDGDFVTFGNAVMHCTVNRRKNALLHHNYHLRDCAWLENIEGKVDLLHRTWKTNKRNIIKQFKDIKGAKISSKITDAKSEQQQFTLRHIVKPAEDYDTGTGDGARKKWTTKFVSIWLDVDNGEIMIEEPSRSFQYVVPRWQTVSGSQYGFSPCTVAGLPDARLIQAMTLVLLEAGEKAANPPMSATLDVVRGDINTYAGGVTWLDKDYDERMGAGLQILPHDISGIPLSDKMREDVKAMLSKAFYLDKLSGPMPLDKPDMTAFEVGQHVQNYVRQALPLFEPMEMDYNAALCDTDFDYLLHEGAFGSVHDMPASLRGQDISFKFRSALHDTIDEQRGPTFMQAKALIAQAYELDPTSGQIIDVKKALRWALQGMRYPEDQIRSEQEMEAIAAKAQQKQSLMETMQAMHAGAQTAQQIGQAGQELQGMQNGGAGAQPQQ